MADLLTNIKNAIADGNLVNEQAPLVSEALGLVKDKSTPLSERLEKIYALCDKAHEAGGIERERCGYIIESLYASANEKEFKIIKAFNRAENNVR